MGATETFMDSYEWWRDETIPTINNGKVCFKVRATGEYIESSVYETYYLKNKDNWVTIS